MLGIKRDKVEPPISVKPSWKDRILTSKKYGGKWIVIIQNTSAIGDVMMKEVKEHIKKPKPFLKDFAKIAEGSSEWL